MFEDLKLWIWNRRMKFRSLNRPMNDASAASREIATGLVKPASFRNGDVTSGDFEEPEFDLAIISEAYNTDSYVRQGIDKYTDQIFKDGYRFVGKDTAIIEYLQQRFAFMAEATGIPFEILLMEITEDVVKYSNCLVSKVRGNDPELLPPNITNIMGINDQDPIVGYFPMNVTQFLVKRDENGTVEEWQQEVESTGDTVEFKADDVVHFYYKREKGNAFGSPFMVPVLDDVRALRQAEENVMKMMYRSIYPFLHVKVGTIEMPGTQPEIDEVKETIDEMEVDGGLVTSSRVEIKAIASDQVIDAAPYLAYLENRIFSGMGVPAVLFGRGDTANRSTSDSMSSEMSDRINAMQHSIEVFFNNSIIKELLLEGGYDYVINPDHLVEFKFNDSDYDTKIKKETHAIYQYEHNAITEDEMRSDIGRDPIVDRGLMFQMLVTQANAAHAESVKGSPTGTSSGTSPGTKETNNKQKPTNQSGTKTSPKKQTNEEAFFKGLLRDRLEEMETWQSPTTIRDRMSVPSLLERERADVEDLVNMVQEMFFKDTAEIEMMTAQLFDRLSAQLNETSTLEDFCRHIKSEYEKFGE